MPAGQQERTCAGAELIGDRSRPPLAGLQLQLLLQQKPKPCQTPAPETASTVKPSKAPQIPLSQRMDGAEAEKTGSPRLPTLTFCKKPPTISPNPQFVPTPIPFPSRPVSLLLAILLWRRRAVRDGRRGAAGSVRTRTSSAGRRQIQSRAPGCGHRRVVSVRVAGRPADGFSGCSTGRRRSSPRRQRGGMARLPRRGRMALLPWRACTSSIGGGRRRVQGRRPNLGRPTHRRMAA
jgi:hypothetical protein